MRRYQVGVICLVALVLVVQTLLIAQDQERKKVKRAIPPTFADKEFDGIFFDDVFQQGLVGTRPANLNQPGGGQPVTPGGGDGGNSGGSGTDGSGGGSAGGLYAWKDIISRTAIEDEVKGLNIALQEDVTTPNKFASGGYKKARRHFTMLALLFAIISEFDGDVRWKKDAPALRDLFARAAAGAKVGSQAAYNESKLRKEDLQLVVGGGSFTATKEAEPKANWSALLDRSPLMQRLETARQLNIQPWTSSENEYKSKLDELVREANVVAAISEVLMQDGMPEAEEEDYTVHAKRMRDAAREIIASAKSQNYDQASKAVSVIGQACDLCHADWR